VGVVSRGVGLGGAGMRRHVQSTEQHGERAKSKRGGLERGDVPRSRSRTEGAVRWCRRRTSLIECIPVCLKK